RCIRVLTMNATAAISPATSATGMTTEPSPLNGRAAPHSTAVPASRPSTKQTAVAHSIRRCSRSIRSTSMPSSNHSAPTYAGDMSTHIAAAPGDIAPVVLFPGDPLRAKWIAENFLEDATLYSEVRGMLGFTGTWNGHRISVQGSGMGQPSMSIYANELFDSYEVQTIVRVGSCGGLTERVGMRDIIIASGACTDSGINRVRFHGLDYAPVADFSLLRAAVEASEELTLDVGVHVGLLFSSDQFYSTRPELTEPFVAHGALAVEVEPS